MFDHEPTRVFPPLRPRLLMWTLVGAILVGVPFFWVLGWLLAALGLIEGPPLPIEVWYDPYETGGNSP